MKKIISTAAAVLAFSMAFADVSVEFTQAGYLSSDRDGKSVKLDVNGYDDEKKVTGCVVTEISNEFAGVVFDFDPYIKDVGRDYVDNASNKMFDQYYGWVNFMGGKAKLQSGVWKSRSVNRMKKDAGSWENSEYEAFKPGVINGSIAKDVTNLTEGNLSTQITYSLDNGYAKAAIVSSDYGASSLKSGFALEGGFNINEDTNVKVYFKNLKDQEIAFAVFGESTGLKEGLDLVAGFTAGNAKTESGFEYAFDVRARYELNDKIAFTTMNNISSTNEVYALWDMLSVAYKLSDKTKLTVTGKWGYADLSVEKAGVLSIIPGITYSPCDGADITTGLILETTGWKKPSTSSISIPVVLHVAL